GSRHGRVPRRPTPCRATAGMPAPARSRPGGRGPRRATWCPGGTARRGGTPWRHLLACGHRHPAARPGSRGPMTHGREPSAARPRPPPAGWRGAGRACYNETHDHRSRPGASMVAAAPFRGLRFDAKIVGDPGAVTAPPYDVITPAARDRYEAQNPYNMVRLILARTDRDSRDRYRPVAGLMDAWRAKGALVLDPAPALYLYEEAYELRGTPREQRRGVRRIS